MRRLSPKLFMLLLVAGVIFATWWMWPSPSENGEDPQVDVAVSPLPPAPPPSERPPRAEPEEPPPEPPVPEFSLPTEDMSRQFALDFTSQLRRLRVSPVFTDGRVDGYGVDPFLVFMLHGGTPAAARAAAKEAATLAAAQHARFRESFGPALELPDLSTLGRADLRTLTVVLFPSQKSFAAYRSAIGRPVASSHRGTYRRIDHVSKAVWNQDEGEAPRTMFADPYSTLGILCGHEMLHAYRRAMQDQKTDEEVLWTAESTRSDSLWLEEGLPGLSAQESLTEPPEIAIATWKYLTGAGLNDWPFSDLLSLTSVKQLISRAAKFGLRPRGDYPLLFQAQATCFCWFLWNFEDGKYRQRFLEAIRKDFLGESGEEVVSEVLFGDPGSRKAMEWEWLETVNRLLAD